MKAFYDKNGYFVYPKLVDMSKCNQMLESIRKHANKDYAAIVNPDRIDFLAQQSPIKNEGILQETAILMRNIMKDQSIVEVLECFQGEPVVGLMSQMLFKEVGSPYANQAWNPHQDNAYLQNKNSKYLTTNLFLEDANLTNGTMFFYPKSHHEPLLPFTPTKSYRENIGNNPGLAVKVPSKYEKVDVCFKKGDVLFLHGNTIHGSYPNVSKKYSRPLYSCSYISRGEEFISGNTAKREIIYLN